MTYSNFVAFLTLVGNNKTVAGKIPFVATTSISPDSPHGIALATGNWDEIDPLVESTETFFNKDTCETGYFNLDMRDLRLIGRSKDLVNECVKFWLSHVSYL